MKLNLGSGSHPLDGFVNLDMDSSWRMEDGLPYGDSGVEAITISCVMYAVRQDSYPFVFKEFYRVLESGGIVRITDNDTEHPESRFYNTPYESGYGPTVLTGPKMMRRYLEEAGFAARDVTSATTQFRDGSLLQDRHGAVPNVFFIEGVKP